MGFDPERRSVIAGGLHRETSPYDGCWFVCMTMVVTPALLYVILRWVFSEWSHDSLLMQKAQCMAFAGGIGFLIALGFAISGGLKKPFKIVKARVSDFFSDLAISPRLAFSGYLNALRTGGVVFWLYLILIVLNLLFCVLGLKNFFKLY